MRKNVKVLQVGPSSSITNVAGSGQQLLAVERPQLNLDTSPFHVANLASACDPHFAEEKAKIQRVLVT